MNTRRILLSLALTLFPIGAHAEDGWVDVLKQVDPEKHAVAGTWQRDDDGLAVGSAAWGRVVIPYRPTGEYDLRVSFTRRSGRFSVPIYFVTPQGQATFELDCWGEGIAGIQAVNGEDNRRNATRTEDMPLTNGKRYTVLIEVRKDRIRCSLDGEEVCALPVTDRLRLSPLSEWELPEKKALGLGAYSSPTVFHSAEVRPVKGDVPPVKPGPEVVGRGAKRVLLVIANSDFFYREYADPKRELEEAGIKVDVAAATRDVCRPHANSGEGSHGGRVTPDLAFADADSQDYAAIVFAGGWGSSAYQYSFPGKYRNAAYQGTRETRETANRLISRFLGEKKYVCGICHGVSVLAWARVDGESPLKGKRVVAPTLSSPAGEYPSLDRVPPSRWNASVNGAAVLPANSVGEDKRSSSDDVFVDGRVITAQDDRSAREFGRVLAERLK